MKPFFLSSIRFYQRYFSRANVCRFSPTCSEYMYQAIGCYGILHGLSLGFRRIVRCHPWNPGGFDPVP